MEKRTDSKPFDGVKSIWNWEREYPSKCNFEKNWVEFPPQDGLEKIIFRIEYKDVTAYKNAYQECVKNGWASQYHAPLEQIDVYGEQKRPGFFLRVSHQLGSLCIEFVDDNARKAFVEELEGRT